MRLVHVILYMYMNAEWQNLRSLFSWSWWKELEKSHHISSWFPWQSVKRWKFLDFGHMHSMLLKHQQACDLNCSIIGEPKEKLSHIEIGPTSSQLKKSNLLLWWLKQNCWKFFLTIFIRPLITQHLRTSTKIFRDLFTHLHCTFDSAAPFIIFLNYPLRIQDLASGHSFFIFSQLVWPFQ